MNQINIDSLLQIGSGAKIEQSLKLDPSQLYQALLQIGRDQEARLSIQTPQGPLQVALPTNTAQQILQTAQQLIAAATPASTQATASATAVPVQNLQNGQNSADIKSSANAIIAGSNTGKATETKVFVQLQPLGTDQLQLTVRLAGKTLTIPLQASQLLQLLQQPAPGPQQHFSVQAQQQLAKTDSLNLQWPVQLSRQGQQLQIQLGQGQPLSIDIAALPSAKHWPEQQLLPARLQLGIEQGQIKLQLQLEPARPGPAQPTIFAEKADPKITPGSGRSSEPGPSAASTGQMTKAATPALTVPAGLTPKPEPVSGQSVILAPNAVRQLIPQLARQIWPEQLGSDIKPWLAQAKVAGPVSSAPGWQWQLKQPDSRQLQLELTPQAEPRQLKLSVSEISRPFQFLPVQPGTISTQPLQTDSRDLWRQWLPLSQSSPDLLADSPALPAAVRQVLQELRAQHPDAAKLQNQQQLMQQINAALQFSPLQMPAQPASVAGGLAIAIQLLLGRLGAQLPAERQNPPQKEKLQQLIGQLDRSQSAQLLRQLSGHSSQLQSAQIANLEQQSAPAPQQKPEQLLIQLPLLQNGESRFAELAVSEREAEGAEQRSGQRCWQLTMKFDLGNQGEMLVQVRLIGKEVSLQFYADNEKTVADTGQFLPLFKDRLTMQGLQVAEAGCQLGKIPEHLYQRGTSLLQVRV
ncbi:MAG: flagellar hook-length control protein FliK [Rheinheimera sp.]|nr:MAG: flagellar hook-length control protein FliK [Rheinheimera sp.]